MNGTLAGERPTFSPLTKTVAPGGSETISIRRSTQPVMPSARSKSSARRPMIPPNGWEIAFRAADVNSSYRSHRSHETEMIWKHCHSPSDRKCSNIKESETAPRWIIRDRLRTPPILRAVRSEEHTSELQSLRHLVCRLLLEK